MSMDFVGSEAHRTCARSPWIPLPWASQETPLGAPKAPWRQRHTITTCSVNRAIFHGNCNCLVSGHVTKKVAQVRSQGWNHE